MAPAHDRSARQAAHVLGLFNLSAFPAIVSPEHTEHADARLTQKHEKTHRDLTFSSTYGVFSFVMSQIANSHPDPIHRYRFKQSRTLLIDHSLDPQEGCAYFNEAGLAAEISSEAVAKVRSAASDRERWAMDWVRRAVSSVGLGGGLQAGLAYLLADLSMCGPIVKDFQDGPPDPERLAAYLQADHHSPNARFLAFARAAYFWRRWSLRRRLHEVLDQFSAETGVDRKKLDADPVDLDRPQIARLDYLMDRALEKWLAESAPQHPIVPIEERMPAVQSMLDRWLPQLPNESRAVLPDGAEFMRSSEFFQMNDAELINPPRLERTYRKVHGLEAIRAEINERELCVCIVSRNAWPLVELQQFADRRLPEGMLQLTVSIFDPTLPGMFTDVGYAWWGPHESILAELKSWSAPRTVIVALAEDVTERGGRVLGVPRAEIPCSIRILRSGLVNSQIPKYLASLGSSEYPVRAHFIASGKAGVSVLAAKTDEYTKLEFIAPVTPLTAVLMQSQEYAQWVSPKLRLEEYEPREGQVRATVNACERVIRYGFG